MSDPGTRRPGTLSALSATVITLLSLTAALLVWVGVQTVRAGNDLSVRSGLDYEVFLRSVDDLILGAGDSALIRFDEVEEGTTRRPLRFDTLVIVADARSFPSFDRGGFLYDQVQAYNRFQKDRAAVGAADREWFDKLRPYNPSIFRADRTPDGTTDLSRAPSAWSLRVRSPLEGEWNGEVRTREVFRTHGFVGPATAVSLREPTSLRPGREAGGRAQGRTCEFVPDGSLVKAYCLSEERIAQASFRLEAEDDGGAWAEAGWTDLWMDGTRIRPGNGAPMPEGTVLRIEPLEPLVFSRYWEGVVSSKQWVNGRMRRQNDPAPPMDLFSGLGAASVAGGRNAPGDAFIEVTVDAELSMRLSRILTDFLDSEVDLPLDFAAMVLARVPKGDIVALAETGERRNRGRSPVLERVAPGSAVKPLLAAAILSQRPDLGSLKVRARSGSVSTVLGMPRVPQRRAFSTALNCPAPADGWVDLRYFLRCSNNEYAASLLVAGLSNEDEAGGESRGSGSLGLEGTVVGPGTLLRSPLSEGLTELYDLPTDPLIADAMGRSRRVWDGLRFSDGSPVQVPYELLPSESRPALLAPGSQGGTDLSLLYRYAYGAWENQWTLLDLTNGFARIVTDRRVQLTFSPTAADGVPHRPTGSGSEPASGSGSTTGPESGPDSGSRSGPDSSSGPDSGSGSDSASGTGRILGESLGLVSNPWYPELLGGLKDAAKDGTARGLRTAWVRQGLPSTIFAKTGTLNEPGEPGPADDLFSKSLLFAVGEPADEPGRPLECGMVGSLYLRFSEGPRSGSLPSVQVQFAVDRLGAFLRDHWDEITGCGPREG